MSVPTVLVLRPSSVPERVGVNQNDAIKKWYSNRKYGVGGTEHNQLKDAKAKRLKVNDVKQ